MQYGSWLVSRSRLHQRGCAMNRTADSDVGPAATDVGQVGIDIGVGWLRVFLQERHRCHDLPGLTVAALWYVLGKPGLLHRMLCVGGQAFDRSDVLIGH